MIVVDDHPEQELVYDGGDEVLLVNLKRGPRTNPRVSAGEYRLRPHWKKDYCA